MNFLMQDSILEEGGEGLEKEDQAYLGLLCWLNSTTRSLGVTELVLNCSPGITNDHVRGFLKECPNLRRFGIDLAQHLCVFRSFLLHWCLVTFSRLDLSYTNVDHRGFDQSLVEVAFSNDQPKNIPLSRLEELNLEGCR